MSKKILIQCDQSGADALIVAYLCQHGKFRDLFLHGIKPHTYVAMYVFKDIWQKHLINLPGGLGEADDMQRYITCPIPELKQLKGWTELDKLIRSSDNWPSNQRYYYLGKKIVHASNYAMQAGTFSLSVLTETEGDIALNKREAETYLASYHTLFPEIKQWHRETERLLRALRILYNFQGYPREFTDVITESLLRDAYIFVPQSTVGTITNIAITQLQNYIEEYEFRWDILNNCHDSMLVQCPDDPEEIHNCANRMHGYMTPELTSPRGEKFRMRAEVQVGRNWSSYDEKKNPNGLKEYKIL